MFSIRGLRLYFPELEPWVVWSASLPPHPRLSTLSVRECGAAGSASCSLACLFHNPPPCWVCQPPPCCESCPHWLPVSAPPTGLDECFFFISLVVGLPCGLIFCQFWLAFVFKLLLSFFWLCEKAQCVYLHLHLGRKPLHLSYNWPCCY